ncbi:MAG: hypothetical protein ACOCRL_02415 [Bacillota bacterium]
MINSIVKIKELKIFIKRFLICLFILFSITTISLASISPGSIKIDIDSSSDELYANNSLTLRKKHKHGLDIYYQIADYYLDGVNLAEYIMAKTPYTSYYQSLDQAVLFLDEADELSEVIIKMRLDENILNILSRSSNKKHTLDLFSKNGKNVKIDLHLKIESTFTVIPGEIDIIADNGPAFYTAEDYVTIGINRENSNWNILIEAEPIVYQGNYNTANSQINPEDLYISLNSNDNFVSLETPYLINGYNYSKKTDIDLYLGTEINWEHIAGDYSGQVIITISE